MNRRDFLRTAGLGLGVFSLGRWELAAAESAAGGRPNIIFILADDLGISEIGSCGGDHYKTPNIDALAQGGIRFEYSYSTPLCGPSRCEILTGRYPFRTGHIGNEYGNAVSPEKEIMLPTVMRKAGYVTAMIGKWGQICLGPKEWGFDEHLVWNPSSRYWRGSKPVYELNGEKRDLAKDEYMPDTMHKFFADFMERNRGKPFYIHYSLSHIHSPILRTPDSRPDAKEEEHYADNIAYMDKLVGQLVVELDRLHLRERTLVVFTGDNGTAHFGVSRSTIGGRKIHGQKGTLLEGGSRVPLIVNWPGTAPAGKLNTNLTDFSDFFPTFAELGGAPLSENVEIDGHSFASQIKGEKGSPREWVYVELKGGSYVRDARYKLTNKGEMFDMKDAPFNEIPVPADSADPDASAARKRLQEVLDKHPAAATAKSRDGKKKKKKQNKAAPQITQIFTD